MPDPDPPREEVDLDSSARLRVEQAENADDATRLRALDDLYQQLEAELAEDEQTRS